MLVNSEIVIVLVNYNSYSDTKECIRSIKSHEASSSYIVVIDNNSEDAYLLDKLKKEYEQLHIIKNSSNVGFAKANNIGIKWAYDNLDFRYILFLNNDTLITQGAISKLLASFEIDPKIGVTTGRINYDNNRRKVWYGGGELDPTTGRPKIVDLNCLPNPEGAGKSRFVTYVSGCLLMISRKCLDEVGGFDNDYFMYCEDVEFSIRISKSNFKVWYNADAVIYHKVGGSQSSSSFTGLHHKNPTVAFHFYHKLFNLWLTFKKHKKSFDPIKFRLNFIMLTGYKFIYLTLFSKYRYKVIKSFSNLLKSIHKYDQ